MKCNSTVDCVDYSVRKVGVRASWFNLKIFSTSGLNTERKLALPESACRSFVQSVASLACQVLLVIGDRPAFVLRDT